MTANYGLIGQKVKQKYPQYQQLSDDQVGEMVVQKYPQYATNPAFSASTGQRTNIADRPNPYSPNIGQKAILGIDQFTKGRALPNIGQFIAGVASVPYAAPISATNPTAGKAVRTGVGALGRVGGEVTRQALRELQETEFEGDTVGERYKNIASEVKNIPQARITLRSPEERLQTTQSQNLRKLGGEATTGLVSEAIGEFIVAPILNKTWKFFSQPVRSILQRKTKQTAQAFTPQDTETLTKAASTMSDQIDDLTVKFRQTGDQKILRQISELSDQKNVIEITLGSDAANSLANPQFIKPTAGEKVYQSSFTVPRGLARQVRPQRTVKKMIDHGVGGSLEDIANTSSTVTGSNGIITRMQRDALDSVQGDIEIPRVVSIAKKAIEESDSISERDASAIIRSVYRDIRPGTRPNTWNSLDAFDAVQAWEKLAAQHRNAGYSVFNPKVKDQQIAHVYNAIADEVKDQLDRTVVDQGLLAAVKTPDRIATLRQVGNGKVAEEVLAAENFTDLRHIASDYVNIGKMVQSTWDQQITPFNRLVEAMGNSSITGNIRKLAVSGVMNPQTKTQAGLALSKIGQNPPAGVPGINVPDLTPVGQTISKYLSQQSGLKATEVLNQARQELLRLEDEGQIPTPTRPVQPREPTEPFTFQPALANEYLDKQEQDLEQGADKLIQPAREALYGGDTITAKEFQEKQKKLDTPYTAERLPGTVGDFFKDTGEALSALFVDAPGVLVQGIKDATSGKSTYEGYAIKTTLDSLIPGLGTRLFPEVSNPSGDTSTSQGATTSQFGELMDSGDVKGTSTTMDTSQMGTSQMNTSQMGTSQGGKNIILNGEYVTDPNTPLGKRMVSAGLIPNTKQQSRRDPQKPLTEDIYKSSSNQIPSNLDLIKLLETVAPGIVTSLTDPQKSNRMGMQLLQNSTREGIPIPPSKSGLQMVTGSQPIKNATSQNKILEGIRKIFAQNPKLEEAGRKLQTGEKLTEEERNLAQQNALMFIASISKGTGVQETYLRKGQPPIGQIDPNDSPLARERFNIPKIEKLSGGGSDRDVFDLGDDVLKVAKRSRGIDQNQTGVDYYASQKGLIPEIREVGKNYTVFEKVSPPNSETRKFVSELRKAYEKSPNSRNEGMINAFNSVAKKYGDDSPEALTAKGLSDFNVATGDVLSLRNWGTRDGVPILVDDGALSGSYLTTATRGSGKSAFGNDALFNDIVSQSQSLKGTFGDIDYFTKFMTLLGLGGLIKKGTDNQEKKET